MLGGQDSLSVAAGFDLPFARSDDRYTFWRWLALAVEKNTPCFGGEFFHHWRGIRNVPQLVTDEVYKRLSLPADFLNVRNGSQYLWRRSSLFERRARDQLDYLVSCKCVEVFSFTKVVKMSPYVPLPSNARL